MIRLFSRRLRAATPSTPAAPQALGTAEEAVQTPVSSLSRSRDSMLAFHHLRAPETTSNYDLIVLGSGPAGQKCAVDSAKRGKRVAVVDKSVNVGGVCVHTGTIPSKTFREAAINLTGYRSRTLQGAGSLNRVTSQEILDRVYNVEKRQASIVLGQLKRNNITTISGYGKFVGPNTVEVHMEDGSKHRYHAKNVLIGVGTHPNRGKNMPFHHRKVYDGDLILSKDLEIPRSIIVVGGGVIGMEYATSLSIIPGTKVTVIDGNSRLLGFCDHEVIDMLCSTFQADGGRLILNDTVEKCEVVKHEVVAHLKSGKKVIAESLLYCMGRQASTDFLDLATIDAQTTKRGQVSVNKDYQVLAKDGSVIPGVYAAGDVIGFPALASTSMEQGRRASCHMWGEQITATSASTEFFPYGIYTVPEISCVGYTEQELTTKKIPYDVGIARYEELARAHLIGDVKGMLKLLFCPKTFKLLGVHCIGEGATEIVHIGQAVMALEGTVDFFRNTVFNYPTFAEAYRVAAIAGIGGRKVPTL
eukprot:PhF_6_TR26536/c0_g1_i1/m.38361/K00322/sthA, udhA; NAD(P) transhydrogenase